MPDVSGRKSLVGVTLRFDRLMVPAALLKVVVAPFLGYEDYLTLCFLAAPMNDPIFCICTVERETAGFVLYVL